MKLVNPSIVFILFLSSILQVSATCSLPVPTNLKLKNQTSCSVDVSWKIVTGSSYYRVEYKTSGNGTWIITDNISGTSVTISGLASSTSYEFAVASFCSDNTTTGYSSPLSKTTSGCSAPVNLIASSVKANSATISWTPLCGSSEFTLGYRVKGIATWTNVSHILSTSFTLANLQSNTAYQYRVAAICGTITSSWSPVQAFTTASQGSQNRNILLIVLDDARYDAFMPNGAPSCSILRRSTVSRMRA